MAIRMYEALQLPIMKQTQLLAGKKGLQNWIKWVTIVEVIEDIHRLQDGEFLITTGFGLGENTEKRKEFEKLLSSRKLSGIAIYTGFYLKEIPESFLAIADEFALPFIEIPQDINFSMITKELLVQVVNKQSQTLEYSLRIHQDFTRLVLEQHGFDPITKTLHDILDASIILMAQDDIISSCIKHDFIDINDVKHLYEKQLDNFEMISQPIIANQHTYGHVLIIKEKRLSEELDSIAIEHATTVYAIEFLRRRAIEETHLRLTSDFLDEAVHPIIPDHKDLIERGRKLGVDLSNPQSILFIYFPSVKEENMKENYSQLTEMIQYTMGKSKIPYLMRTKSDSVMVLAEAQTGFNSRELAENLLHQWNAALLHEPIAIGIGKTAASIHELHKRAAESEQAARFSQVLFKPKSIVRYDELGLYPLLIEMKQSGMDLEAYYQKHLETLIDSKGTDLITTLEAYLFFNQSIKKTASELYIHRHTLKYRLDQIQRKTGLDLDDYDNGIKLYLAILAYKLVKHM
ncbi:PucR family transcriptional regulator [Peribacillus sp. SI8-4]|uniref:PucR family transcriptional regulator n=1 Tax=Peribacillus sp. SI8-4 TaxID=3048009 RepID=UPI002553B77C|nr:PucR family transcriptional regulator [Peribacillus sp. SI8-4]